MFTTRQPVTDGYEGELASEVKGSIGVDISFLRLREGTNLRVRDIDSDRMMIHVRSGKGAKDRFVPLPQRTLDLLRGYWTTYRNPTWIFP